MTDQVEVVGPDPAPMAQMMGAIAMANLQTRPHLADALNGSPGVVRITASDIDVVVSIELRDGHMRIYSGPQTSAAEVEIVTDSDTLTEMSSIPKIGPLPNPLKAKGREFLLKTLTGKFKISGALKHGELLRRVQSLTALRT